MGASVLAIRAYMLLGFFFLYLPPITSLFYRWYWDLQELMRLWQEAEARGEEFVPPKPRFECRVEELNNMHIQRRYEEAEALLRDAAWSVIPKTSS